MSQMEHVPAQYVAFRMNAPLVFSLTGRDPHTLLAQARAQHGDVTVIDQRRIGGLFNKQWRMVFQHDIARDETPAAPVVTEEGAEEHDEPTVQQAEAVPLDPQEDGDDDLLIVGALDMPDPDLHNPDDEQPPLTQTVSTQPAQAQETTDDEASADLHLDEDNASDDLAPPPAPAIPSEDIFTDTLAAPADSPDDDQAPPPAVTDGEADTPAVRDETQTPADENDDTFSAETTAPTAADDEKADSAADAPADDENDVPVAASHAADSGSATPQSVTQAPAHGPHERAAHEAERDAAAIRKNAQITAAALIAKAREEVADLREQLDVERREARAEIEQMLSQARAQADQLLRAASHHADQALLEGQALSDTTRLVTESMQAAADRVLNDLKQAHRSVQDRLVIEAVEAKLRSAAIDASPPDTHPELAAADGSRDAER